MHDNKQQFDFLEKKNKAQNNVKIDIQFCLIGLLDLKWFQIGGIGALENKNTIN